MEWKNTVHTPKRWAHAKDSATNRRVSANAQERANAPSGAEEATMVQRATSHQHITTHHGGELLRKIAHRETKTSKRHRGTDTQE